VGSELLDSLRSRFGEAIENIEVRSPRRIFVQVKPEAYKEVIRLLHESGIDFLEAITGVDDGDAYTVIAHLGRSSSIAVKTRLARDNPRIPSIADVYPVAEVYEREAYEMLGIVFEGCPRLTRLLLPDDWPEGVYPLRKDYEPSHPQPGR